MRHTSCGLVPVGTELGTRRVPVGTELGTRRVPVGTELGTHSGPSAQQSEEPVGSECDVDEQTAVSWS